MSNETEGLVETRCDGCGSAWSDADIIAGRRDNPQLRSCCPERKPLNIDQWRARATKAEAERDAAWDQRDQATFSLMERTAAAEARADTLSANCEKLCNSYAEENQRLSDRSNTLSASLAKMQEAVENISELLAEPPYTDHCIRIVKQVIRNALTPAGTGETEGRS